METLNTIHEWLSKKDLSMYDCWAIYLIAEVIHQARITL